MFCSNCGKRIVDDSKFCMYCGSRITYLDAMPTELSSISTEKACNFSNNSEPEKEYVFFPIHGTTLKFDASINEFTLLRKNFLTAFFEQDSVVQQRFSKQRINNLDDYLDIFSEYGTQMLDWLYDRSIDLLLSKGIYNITKNHIIEQYVPNNSTFMREYESFEEKYISVIASEQELAEYRRIKKASRGKWVGGGFGIKGAVKGAVTAGALNLGASVLHGIGDTISSSVERAKINEKKSQVLQERNWALRFSRDLQDDACGLFIQIAKILNEYHKIELPLLDNAQSSAYLENARKITNYDSKVEILLKSIQSYPYKQGAYFDLTQLLGIFDKELICIMEFFLNDEMLELLIKADHARFSKKYLNYEKDSDEQLDSKISEMEKRFTSFEDDDFYKKSSLVTIYKNEVCDDERKLYSNIVQKRCTASDGTILNSVEELERYNHDYEIFSRFFERSRTEWKLDQQFELLSEVKKRGIQAPLVLEKIKTWEEYLNNMASLKENYILSDAYYLKTVFPQESIAHAKEIENQIQSFVGKMPYAPIQTVLFAAELREYNFLADDGIAWLIVSDYSLALFKVSSKNIDVVDMKGVERIRFSSTKLEVLGKTQKEIKFSNYTFSDEPKDREPYERAEKTINGALSKMKKYQGEPICPKCGRPVILNAAFCGECGFRF